MYANLSPSIRGHRMVKAVYGQELFCGVTIDEWQSIPSDASRKRSENES